MRELIYNPAIKTAELAEIVGISRVAVSKALQQLIEKGYVLQDKNDEANTWHVIITDLSR